MESNFEPDCDFIRVGDCFCTFDMKWFYREAHGSVSKIRVPTNGASSACFNVVIFLEGAFNLWVISASFRSRLKSWICVWAMR